jgi:hypothetical protein
LETSLAEEVGRFKVFLYEAAQNFELFSNIQDQNSKSKTYSGGWYGVPLSSRSNLAGLYGTFKKH